MDPYPKVLGSGWSCEAAGDRWEEAVGILNLADGKLSGETKKNSWVALHAALRQQMMEDIDRAEEERDWLAGMAALRMD